MCREHFQELYEGRRHHYVGADKVDVELDDVLWIQEYNPDTNEPTERRTQMRVTCISRAPFVPVGWYVLSLQHISADGHMCCAMRRDRFGDDAPNLSGYAHQSNHPTKTPP